MRKLIVIVVVLLSVILLVSALLYGAYRPLPPADIRSETTASVERAPTNDDVRSADNLEAFERVPVYSKLNDLAVAKINVNIGEAVREGQVLAELDDAPLLSDLRGLQEIVRVAEKDFREAAGGGGVEAERLKRLLDEARGNLADVQMKIGYRYVLAPTSGVLLERNATPGEPGPPGVALFVIGRPMARRSPDVPPVSSD